jgi:ubiquinone/menaquinone biosynthesis C-methylase UbiE
MNRESSMKGSEVERLTISDVWQRFGITKHWGGIGATRRLAEMCELEPRDRVLDIGCGSGFAPCLLAKDYQVHVVALDMNPRLLDEARERVAKEKLTDRVTVVGADAHHLPFAAEVFDAAVAESVLVFCDRLQVTSEVRRVLKPGGIFGDSEVTSLKPTPPELAALLSQALGAEIELSSQDEWRAVYREGGLENVSSIVNRIDYKEQFLSELRIDGLGKRLSAWVEVLTDPALRRTFFTIDKETRQAIGQFSSHVGYGLYTATKP